MPRRLHEAMRYSTFGGGKRLRPILCMATAQVFGVLGEAVLPAAAALEVMHTATLIHDDLPALDNDDLRRGQPTSHKVYGEAQAILVGDALMILAFELLAQAKPLPPYGVGDLVRELAVALGSQGVIGGQWEDIAATGGELNAELLEYIHCHKTAALIRVACRIGAMLGGAKEKDLAAVSCYGEQIGLAFQVVDDILNVTSTPEAMGKACGNDAAQKKITYPAVFGLEAAQNQAEALVRQALAAIRDLPGDVAALQKIAQMVVRRGN